MSIGLMIGMVMTIAGIWGGFGSVVSYKDSNDDDWSVPWFLINCGLIIAGASVMATVLLG